MIILYFKLNNIIKFGVSHFFVNGFNLLDNLKDYLIKKEGEYDFFVNNKYSINLHFYKSHLSKWIENKKLK